MDLAVHSLRDRAPDLDCSPRVRRDVMEGDVMSSSTRIERLRSMLSDGGYEGANIRSPANVSYLSGYPSSAARPSLIIIASTRAVLVAPGSVETSRLLAQTDISVIGYAVPGATVDRVAEVERLSGEALQHAVDLTGLGGKRIRIEETQPNRAQLPLGQKLCDLRMGTKLVQGTVAVLGRKPKVVNQTTTRGSQSVGRVSQEDLDRIDAVSSRR